MQLTGFIGPSYTLRSPNVDCQRTVNLYPEVNELGSGKNHEVAALVSTPGLSRLYTLSNGPIRCLFTASNGRAFALSGNAFYEIGGIAYGVVDTTSGPAHMTDNGYQLLLVAGHKGYVFTFADNSFVQVTDDAFPKATTCAFLDNWLLVNDADTGRFQFALADAKEWDGLDMSTAEGSPDNLVTLIVNNRELVLLGTDSTEVWFNCGDSNQPFARIQGAFSEVGCAAAESARYLDHTVLWLAKDKNGGYQVVRLDGYVPKRVSTNAVELALNSYGDLSAATSWTYSTGSHSFYCLNAGGDTTWCYDVATGLWHERNYNGNERHRAENHCFWNGKHLVGDYENGNMYELSESVYTDNGTAITRERIGPHVTADNERMSISEVAIDMQTGIGKDGSFGLDADPMVMFQYSKDGGHKWSQERQASAGKIGEYKRRVVFRRFGSMRDFIPRVRITDPVPVTLISAFLK